MKYFLTFVLLLSVMAFAGDHKDHAHAKMEKAEKMTCELEEGQSCTAISLPTAQCSMCEKSISTALKEVDGVTLAKVDAKAKSAHVHYTSADVKVADLEKAIAAVGYDANDTKRDEEAHAKLPACCQLKK